MTSHAARRDQTAGRIVRLMGVSFSLLTIVIAGLLCLAELVLVAPRNLVAQWEKEPGAATFSQAESAYRAVMATGLVEASSPEAIYYAGALCEWIVFLDRGRPEGRPQCQPDEFYREALRQRPMWGALWALVAKRELLDGDRTAARRAWETAMRFASRDVDGSFLLARVGVGLASDLPGEQSRQLKALLEYRARWPLWIVTTPEEQLALEYLWPASRSMISEQR